MERTHDGFEVAERAWNCGSGVMGTCQHGVPDAHWLDIKRDAVMLEEARVTAALWTEGNLSLSEESRKYLIWILQKRFGKDGQFLQWS